MNLFEIANYPTREPVTVVAGDRWVWKRTDLGTDYPPASYALTYSLRKEGTDGTASIEIEATASESGSDYIIEIGATTTAAYKPGDYQWAAYITDSSDSTKRIRVGYGSLRIKTNLETSTDDPRSHAKKMLDYIEAALENRATEYQLDVLAYTIGGRSATRDPEKLQKWRNYYRNEVKGELAAENVNAGGRDGSLVASRMRG